MFSTKHFDSSLIRLQKFLWEQHFRGVLKAQEDLPDASVDNGVYPFCARDRAVCALKSPLPLFGKQNTKPGRRAVFLRKNLTIRRLTNDDCNHHTKGFPVYPDQLLLLQSPRLEGQAEIFVVRLYLYICRAHPLLKNCAISSSSASVRGEEELHIPSLSKSQGCPRTIHKNRVHPRDGRGRISNRDDNC